MPDEHGGAYAPGQLRSLQQPAGHAPWREVLRSFFGSRDRALVLEDVYGTAVVMWPRRYRPAASGGGDGDEWWLSAWRAAQRYPDARPSLAKAVTGHYRSAHHVDLAETREWRAVLLPGEHGGMPVTIHLEWWVWDPARVVMDGTRDGWDLVRTDLRHRLEKLYAAGRVNGVSLDADQVLRHLQEPQSVSDRGLAYRLFDIRSRETSAELLLDAPGGGSFPHVWTADRRAEFDFCLQAVRNGPASLAALWLLRHPDQVPEVLQWVTGHQPLLRAETDWQEEMAGLLGSLSAQEKEELSKVVKDRLTTLGRSGPRGGTADGLVDGSGQAGPEGWGFGPAGPRKGTGGN
ncbi:hypothetical protein ACWGIB_11695 [Streptomyces xiamenensis]